MNNKRADQTMQMRRLISAFVVGILHKQVFWWSSLIITWFILRTNNTDGTFDQLLHMLAITQIFPYPLKWYLSVVFYFWEWNFGDNLFKDRQNVFLAIITGSTRFVVKCATRILKIGWQVLKLCPKIFLNRVFSIDKIARKGSNCFPWKFLKS